MENFDSEQEVNLIQQLRMVTKTLAYEEINNRWEEKRKLQEEDIYLKNRDAERKRRYMENMLRRTRNEKISKHLNDRSEFINKKSGQQNFKNFWKRDQKTLPNFITLQKQIQEAERDILIKENILEMKEEGIHQLNKQSLLKEQLKNNSIEHQSIKKEKEMIKITIKSKFKPIQAIKEEFDEYDEDFEDKIYEKENKDENKMRETQQLIGNQKPIKQTNQQFNQQFNQQSNYQSNQQSNQQSKQYSNQQSNQQSKQDALNIQYEYQDDNYGDTREQEEQERSKMELHEKKQRELLGLDTNIMYQDDISHLKGIIINKQSEQQLYEQRLTKDKLDHLISSTAEFSHVQTSQTRQSSHLNNTLQTSHIYQSPSNLSTYPSQKASQIAIISPYVIQPLRKFRKTSPNQDRKMNINKNQKEIQAKQYEDEQQQDKDEIIYPFHKMQSNQSSLSFPKSYIDLPRSVGSFSPVHQSHSPFSPMNISIDYNYNGELLQDMNQDSAFQTVQSNLDQQEVKKQETNNKLMNSEQDIKQDKTDNSININKSNNLIRQDPSSLLNKQIHSISPDYEGQKMRQSFNKNNNQSLEERLQYIRQSSPVHSQPFYSIQQQQQQSIISPQRTLSPILQQQKKQSNSPQLIGRSFTNNYSPSYISQSQSYTQSQSQSPFPFSPAQSLRYSLLIDGEKCQNYKIRRKIEKSSYHSITSVHPIAEISAEDLQIQFIDRMKGLGIMNSEKEIVYQNEEEYKQNELIEGNEQQRNMNSQSPSNNIKQEQERREMNYKLFEPNLNRALIGLKGVELKEKKIKEAGSINNIYPRQSYYSPSYVHNNYNKVKGPLIEPNEQELFININTDGSNIMEKEQQNEQDKDKGKEKRTINKIQQSNSPQKDYQQINNNSRQASPSRIDNYSYTAVTQQFFQNNKQINKQIPGQNTIQQSSQLSQQKQKKSNLPPLRITNSHLKRIEVVNQKFALEQQIKEKYDILQKKNKQKWQGQKNALEDEKQMMKILENEKKQKLKQEQEQQLKFILRGQLAKEKVQYIDDNLQIKGYKKDNKKGKAKFNQQINPRPNSPQYKEYNQQQLNQNIINRQNNSISEQQIYYQSNKDIIKTQSHNQYSHSLSESNHHFISTKYQQAIPDNYNSQVGQLEQKKSKQVVQQKNNQRNLSNSPQRMSQSEMKNKDQEQLLLNNKDEVNLDNDNSENLADSENVLRKSFGFGRSKLPNVSFLEQEYGINQQLQEQLQEEHNQKEKEKEELEQKMKDIMLEKRLLSEKIERLKKDFISDVQTSNQSDNKEENDAKLLDKVLGMDQKLREAEEQLRSIIAKTPTKTPIKTPVKEYNISMTKSSVETPVPKSKLESNDI